MTKKRLLTLLFSLVMSAAVLIQAPMQAWADGTVIYDGEAREFIFDPGSGFSPTDLFTDFKNVIPGDSLTQQIFIRNDISKKVKVKIYLRSCGWTDGSEEFLDQLNLQVEQVNNPNGSQNGARLFKESPDASNGLTDWICLGTFYSGAEVTLNVTLDIPLKMDNDHQGVIGGLDWEFMVEEFPVDPDDPLPGTNTDTGDDSNAFFFIAVAAGSVVAIIVMLVARRKRGSDEEEQD